MSGRPGVHLERIRPRQTEQNGRHERTHFTLKNEATRPAARNFLQQQAAMQEAAVVDAIDGHCSSGHVPSAGTLARRSRLSTFQRFCVGGVPACNAFEIRAFGSISKEVRVGYLLRANSPINLVDKINRPLFMAYGGLDRNVLPAQGQQLARALDRANKKYESMYKPDEAHGYFSVENRVELYSKMEAFLRQHLGPITQGSR